MHKASPGLLFLFLFAITVLGFWFSLVSGSANISLLDAFLNKDALESSIFWQLRLPRTATAFVTGALLGIAGTLMQVLLRNPLADPYVLGVSGGASAASLLAMLLGASTFWLSASAFAGSLVSILLVFVLANLGGRWDTMRLLLTGVVLAAGWGALISLLLVISPTVQVQSMLYWLMGDLSYATMPVFGSAMLIAALMITLFMARSLNLLTGGEQQATALGVDAGKIQLSIYLLASLLTATAVTQAGNIGFIGLITPHLLRLTGARDHRTLIPAVVLLGGSLLMFADALSRTVIAPRQLPVGVLTALLGVPLFLFLLYRSGCLRRE